MFCGSALDRLWTALFSSKLDPLHRETEMTDDHSPDQEENTNADLPTPPSMPSLCRACQSQLFSFEGFRKAIADFHDSSTGYSYTTTWRDISRSVTQETCTWCSLLEQAKNSLPTDRTPQHADESVDVKIEITINPQVDWTDVTNMIKCYINGYPAAAYCIFADESELSIYDALTYTPDSCALTGDPSAAEIGIGNHIREEEPYVDYQIAIDSITECSRHEHCPDVAETYLPTRVIDCLDPNRPRLTETRRQVKAQYCALSYVWGGEQRQKTTTKNIDAYINEGINIPLPLTISDAIIVTHKLGIRYLWVDALCIIQDSAEDKTRELADMAHIYRDSYVTISVLSAYRADAGFLPDEHPIIELPFHTSEGSLGRMRLKYSIPRQSRSRGYKHQVVESHSPLDQRGWCFQESILSPRKLIFQPPHVRYDCRSWSRDLTRPSAMDFSPQSPYRVDEHTLHPASEIRRTANMGETDDEQLYDLWCGMLTEYSRRQISVPADKLVAFSSVVEEFQFLMKDDYRAGVWKRRLIDNILWEIFREPDEALPSRPQNYRAPTWSWASVDGMVMPHRSHMFELPSTEYEAEILSCDVTPKSSVHPLGEIMDAKLTMKAKIVQLMPNGRKSKVTEKKGSVHKGLFETTLIGGSWILPTGNCLEPQTSQSDPERTQEQDGKRIKIQFDCLEGTSQDYDHDFYVVMLRAGRRWGDQEGYRNESWMRGLLLLRAEGPIEAYRRVAKLDLWNWTWPEWVEPLQAKVITLI